MSDPVAALFSAVSRLLRRPMIVAGAAVVLLVSASAIAALWDASKDTIGFELGKILLQFIFIVLAGAIVKSLADDYQQSKASEERKVEAARVAQAARRDSLRAVLDRATASYQAVKAARRMLRGSVRRADEGQLLIPTHLYDKQFVLLNDLQLDFELLASEVSDDGAVSIEEGGLGLQNSEQLATQFKTMEEYLANLLREYERLRPSFHRKSGERRLGDLPELSRFLGPEGFRSFSDAFTGVRKAFRAELSKELSNSNT